LPSDARAVRGNIQFLGIQDNFFNVNPPPMPKNWTFSAKMGPVSKIAEITIDTLKKTGSIVLDQQIFNDPNVPEGCKIFMFFHELGHPQFKEKEHLCDEFAFWHALRAGVSPFMCFLALAAYMPEQYNYRVERLAKLILRNPQLKKYTDANQSISN
jgi:hypothetical protein